MNKRLIIAGLSVLSTLPYYDERDIYNYIYDYIYGNVSIYSSYDISRLSSSNSEDFERLYLNSDLCDYNEHPNLGILLSDENYIKKDITKQKVLERLNLIQKLDEDWDGYGALKISIAAINNCRTIINQLPLDIIQDVNIMPSEFGGVQLELEKDNSIVNCDFGDETFSYYIEKKGDKTEYYSFLNYTNQNEQKLISDFSLMKNV